MQNAKVLGKAVFPPDVSAFREAVASSLKYSSPEKLEHIYQQQLNRNQSNAAALQLDILQICLIMNRKRAARHWLERLVDEPTMMLRPETVIDAIKAATQLGYADQVFCLWKIIVANERSFTAHDRFEAAGPVMKLARRMRLPYGRDRAWTKHLKLLKIASRLLESALPQLNERSTQQADTMLDEARRLGRFT